MLFFETHMLLYKCDADRTESCWFGVSMHISLCEFVCLGLCVFASVHACVLILQHTDPLKGLNRVYPDQ